LAWLVTINKINFLLPLIGVELRWQIEGLSIAQTAYHSLEYQKARDILGDGADRLFVIVDGLPD